jgi:hypothetical protein
MRALFTISAASSQVYGVGLYSKARPTLSFIVRDVPVIELWGRASFAWVREARG